METAPRKSIETDPMRQVMKQIRDLRGAIEALQRTSTLRNASISGGEGLRILDDDGTPQVQIAPDRTVTVFDGEGLPVVRMGDMAETGPEAYGIEVRVADGSWVQLGSQSVAWANVGALPSTYDPATQKWSSRPHTHPGSEIFSAVANATNAVNATSATNATNATLAQQAEGSQYGWTNNVGGTEFYALWVGNNGGYKFGRNTSSIKYKTNVRSAADEKPEKDPRRILKLRPVVYDRKPTLEVLPEGAEGPRRVYPGRSNEYGLIAEETLPHVPEVVTYFEGKIDGIRYDLLPVAMIPLLQQQDKELQELRAENAAIKDAIRKLGGQI